MKLDSHDRVHWSDLPALVLFVLLAAIVGAIEEQGYFVDD